jgi:hypothetical protein
LAQIVLLVVNTVILWEYEIMEMPYVKCVQAKKGEYTCMLLVHNIAVYPFIIYAKNDLEHRYHIQSGLIFPLLGAVYYLGLLLYVLGRDVISHMCDLQI